MVDFICNSGSHGLRVFIWAGGALPLSLISRFLLTIAPSLHKLD